MAIALHIDQAGGANFEGYDLRNVGRLAVGQLALPDAGFNFQWTGAAKGVALTMTGIATYEADVAFAVTNRVIRTNTADGADTFRLTFAGGGERSTARGAHIDVFGNEHATEPGHLNIVAGGPSGIIVFAQSNGVEVGRMTGGVLAWGTTVTTGATAGDVVLATSKYLRAVNAAGNGTTRVIAGSTVGGNDMVSINPDAVGVIGLGSVTSVGGAAAGDVVLANSKDIRFVNNLGNGTIEGLTVLGGSDNIYLGREAGAIVLGNPATSAGAAAGDLVIGNGKMLHAVDLAGTGLHILIRSSTWSSRDVTQVAYSSVLMVGSPNYANNATAGEVVLGTQKAIRSVNTAGTTTIPMIQLNADNRIKLGADGSGVVVGNYIAGATVPVAAADLNGALVTSDNGRLYYYSAGTRYYIAGTAG